MSSVCGCSGVDSSLCSTTTRGGGSLLSALALHPRPAALRVEVSRGISPSRRAERRDVPGGRERRQEGPQRVAAAAWAAVQLAYQSRGGKASAAASGAVVYGCTASGRAVPVAGAHPATRGRCAATRPRRGAS